MLCVLNGATEIFEFLLHKETRRRLAHKLVTPTVNAWARCAISRRPSLT